MLSGRRSTSWTPRRFDVEIADIAHGLARVARWNGQTRGAHIFSVAQHTLLVEAVMREQTPRSMSASGSPRCCTMRRKYVIGDMISPFKAVLGGDYKAVEKRLLSAIHIRFGLPPVLADEITRQIKAADRARPTSRRRSLQVLPKPRRNACSARGSCLPPASVRDYLTPDRGQGRKAVPGAVQDAASMNIDLLSPRRRAKPIIARTKGPPDPRLLACPTSDTVKATGPVHVLTVMANVDQVQRPESVLPANHLKISMDDITEQMMALSAPLGFAYSSRS